MFDVDKIHYLKDSTVFVKGVESFELPNERIENLTIKIFGVTS